MNINKTHNIPLSLNIGTYVLIGDHPIGGYYANGLLDSDFDYKDDIEMERNDNEHNWDDEEQEMIESNLTRYHDRAFKI